MNQSISAGGTFLIYNQISLIQQFREASAAMLSHRRNSDFTLFDSQVILLTLASSLCIYSNLRVQGARCLITGHVTNNLFPQLVSKLLTDCPQKNEYLKVLCSQN